MKTTPMRINKVGKSFLSRTGVDVNSFVSRALHPSSNCMLAHRRLVHLLEEKMHNSVIRYIVLEFISAKSKTELSNDSIQKHVSLIYCVHLFSIHLFSMSADLVIVLAVKESIKMNLINARNNIVTFFVVSDLYRRIECVSRVHKVHAQKKNTSSQRKRHAIDVIRTLSVRFQSTIQTRKRTNFVELNFQSFEVDTKKMK